MIGKMQIPAKLTYNTSHNTLRVKVKLKISASATECLL